MITLKSLVGPEYQQELPQVAIKHCAYIRGLLEVAPDADSEVEVPFADEAIIKMICAFHEQHKDDAEVEPDWDKKRPRDLTAWDKENFKAFTGMNIVQLLKSVNFLGSQLMLNAGSVYLGQILIVKNKDEIQDFFGRKREFTEEETASVKARYPTPFF
jgi:hypothetical protein